MAKLVYVVVEFDYPEFDWPGEFDKIVGVYVSREDADCEAAKARMRRVEEAELHA